MTTKTREVKSLIKEAYCAGLEDGRHGLLYRPLEIAVDVGDITDGDHSFNDLYHHRAILFAAIGKFVKGWRSRIHYDGTSYPGYFICGIKTPEGDFTYHYPDKYWDQFDHFETLERGVKWDGHTSEDVTRLLSL